MFKKIIQKLTPSKSDSAKKSQESENKSDEQIEAKALKRSQGKESEEQEEARKKDREAKALKRKQMIVEHNKEILERTSPVSYISFLNLL